MKKKLFALLNCAIFSLGILSGCSSVDTSANAEETVTWRIGHEEVNGSIQDEYALKFKELVEEKSNGKVIVEIYKSGEIGSAQDYVQFVQGGLLSFAIVNPGSTGTTVPENNVFYNHFLLPGDNDKIKEFLRTSKAIKMLNEVNEQHEMKVLDWFYEGFNAWTTNKEVRKPADFKGISIRTMESPIIVASYKAYGANPTPIPYMDVYSGLQLKQIDAQVNPIFAIEEMGFYEVQDYLIQAKQDGFYASLVANKEFYDNLNPEYKKILDEIIPELNNYIFDVTYNLNKKRLDNIAKDSDIKIIELTDKEREEFKKASLKSREVYRQSVGEVGNKILDTFEAEIAVLESKEK